MAESYFQLLTEQSGMPAKPFDPVGELKRLRQSLMLRMQEPPKAESNIVVIPPSVAKPPISEPSIIKESEPVALETVVKTVGTMQKKLAVRQRYQFRRTIPRILYYQANPNSGKKQFSDTAAQYLIEPQGGKLEIFVAGLTTLGIIGVVFGALSFCRGLESDLSLGTLVSVSGFAVLGISLGGHLLVTKS